MTDMSGIAGVQARIHEIQQRFAPQTQSSVDVAPPSRSAFPADFDAMVNKLKNSVPGGNTTNLTGTPFTLPNGTSADKLLAAANKYLGVPYVWGGTSATGLDCSGLVQKAFGDIGITMPRVASDQAREGRPVASLRDAKPGDLVAFGEPVDHIGIYVGNNKMIVAPKTGDVVKIQEVFRTPTAIRRILPDEPAFPLTPGVPTTGGSALAKAPAEFRQLFDSSGRKYGVSPALLAAVAQTESNFNPTVVSSAGARGLMQIMPSTARSLGVNPDIPAQAVDGAARLLAEHLQTFRSTELALAAYNAGAGAVQKYGGIPPYAETRSYVRTIMADPGVTT